MYEVTESGLAAFTGTPGQASRHDDTVSALARQNRGIHGTALALGCSSLRALQNATHPCLRGVNVPA